MATKHDVVPFDPRRPLVVLRKFSDGNTEYKPHQAFTWRDRDDITEDDVRLLYEAGNLKHGQGKSAEWLAEEEKKAEERFLARQERRRAAISGEEAQAAQGVRDKVSGFYQKTIAQRATRG